MILAGRNLTALGVAIHAGQHHADKYGSCDQRKECRLFPAQVQQISWHKYDFIGMLMLALVFFACSIAILVGAAQGRHYSLVLCSICSANVALVLYAAARYGRSFPSCHRRLDRRCRDIRCRKKIQVHAGI